MAKKTVITHRDVKTRDENMVRVICGVTKSGSQQDRRREANKRACKDWRPE